MKIFAIIVGLYLSASAMAQQSTTTTFEVFPHNITPRKVKVLTEAFVPKHNLPKLPVVSKADAKTSSPFSAWTDSNGHPKQGVKAMSKDSYKEKLDSVVAYTMSGKPSTKQVMEYNENGFPTWCYNYVPDSNGSGWTRVGHYCYEYDDYGRTTSRESIDNSDTSSSVRFEYIYTDDTPYYSSMIYYVYSDGGWVPYQMCDYKFDENSNTTEELYSQFDAKTQSWVPSLKICSTYDDLHRMTSYFEYGWDTSKQAWYGYTGNYEAQTFEYASNGEDAKISNYIWENDDWLEYRRQIWTRNEDNLVTRFDSQYWNRNSKSWDGNDRYGANGSIKYNSYCEYTYDAKGRELSTKNYEYNASGEPINNYNTITEYNDLEGEITESTTKVYSKWTSSGKPELYKEYYQKNNKYGAELHYKQWNYTAGFRKCIEEDIRDIDANNNYLAGYFYGFTNDEENRRYARVADLLDFPNGWDGSTDLYTPTSLHKMIGVGYDNDDQWIEKERYDYHWDNGDVLVAVEVYDRMSGVDKKSTASWTNYDFKADVSDIYRWPLSNKTEEYDKYKVLSDGSYIDSNGDGEWNLDLTTETTYYYSEFVPTSINIDASAGDVSEIARYDLLGRHALKNSRGIMLVKYSDGTVKKILVK